MSPTTVLQACQPESSQHAQPPSFLVCFCLRNWYIGQLQGVSVSSVEEVAQYLFVFFFLFYFSIAKESPWKRVVCIFKSLLVCARVQPAGSWANDALVEFVLLIL